MTEEYVINKKFEKLDVLNKGEYEQCTFVACNWSEVNLSAYKFIDCTFNNCNWSMAKLVDTVLHNALFQNCKMLGVHFDICKSFGLSFKFEACILNHSSFYKMNIAKTIFNETELQEVDFVEANLSEAIFSNCNLLNAQFDRTCLEKADLSTAFNYSIDPQSNKINRAQFSRIGLAGLLHKFNIKIVD
jgi:fluoroquinolone resistance protein